MNTSIILQKDAPNASSPDDIIAEAKRILARRTRKGVMFNNVRSVMDYLQVNMAEDDREHFVVIFLTTQHQVIAKEVMFSGTIDAARVYPREILKRCLELNGDAVILAHNHPSGVLEPSMADIAITEKIKTVCDVVDIRVLDHIIVTGQGAISLAERGLV